jgi:trehalose 6-phosphate synthase
LLVLSNRGPYTYDGPVTRPIGKRGGGGLIGSVAQVIEGSGGAWIAAPLSTTDRQLARKFPSGRDQDGFTLRFLDLPQQLHHLHYDVMSNEVLWFLFHYLFDTPHLPTFDGLFTQAWDGYRRVNELFAEATVEAAGEAVLVQDYHLMLVGRAIRERTRSKRPLIYFHHTPWCEPSYFRLLPERVGAELLDGLLAHDVVGFHARRWADAFLRCCEAVVPGVAVDDTEVRVGKHTTKIVVAPVPVDSERLIDDANDEATTSWVESHDAMREGRSLLLRVDRIDLSKNPLRGFLAFEHLLQRRPTLVDDLLFLALLYPSRLSVERYKRYYAECLDVVRRINEKHERKMGGSAGPVHLLFQDDFHRSLGAMKLYDALLVNPVFDGLNLVCKEGAVVNERAGSVILSRNAGAFEEIGDAVIPINPFDVPGTADAIEEAYELSGAERDKRSKTLRTLVTRTTPSDWLAAQLTAV